MPSSPNGTMKPGASPSGNVDLASGTVTFSLPLAGVTELRGVGAQVTLHYNSTIDGTDIWNLEAPTGPVGLGWSLLGERILRDPRGDVATDNDGYLLITPEGGSSLVFGGTDGDGEIYFSRNAPFWKIRFQPEFELWTVIRENGDRSFYGGNEKTPFGGARAVEWSVVWGNWIGVSSSGDGQRQHAAVWNLSCRENCYEDRVLYAYEQTTYPVGNRGDHRQQFTAACRLVRVTGPHHDRVELRYQEKDRWEYQRWEEGGPPGADGHQERLDTTYLAALDVFTEGGVKARTVRLEYRSIGQEELRKRLLTEVRAYDPAGAPLDAGHAFAYFGERGEDGVGAGLHYRSRLFNGDRGAVYGALRSHTLPTGGSVQYRFREVALEGTLRELEIQRPEGSWDHPWTYFGPDYVVVLWQGAAGNPGKMHLSVYTWAGKWITETVGPFNVTPDRAATVETRSDFFALRVPGQRDSLQLFTRSQTKTGAWVRSTFDVPVDQGISAIGDRFFAWLLPSQGLLRRFSRDGTGWRERDAEWHFPPMHEPTFAMAADRDTLFFIGAPSEGFAMWSLMRLNHGGDWVEAQRGGGPPLWDRNALVKQRELSVELGDGFAVVRSFFREDPPVIPSTDHHRAFIYRWEDHGQLLDPEVALFDVWNRGSDYRARAVVAGSMVLVDHAPPTMFAVGQNKRHAFRFVGSSWHRQEFDHDSLNNNYIGLDSFSVTRDGYARYHEWNPGAERWEERLPDYKDGNPTAWEKQWSYLSLAEMFLAIPLDWEIALPLDEEDHPFESLKIQGPRTRIAGSFVTYSVGWNIKPINPPGYPLITDWVRLFKNGGLFEQPFRLRDGEPMTHHDGEPSVLVGAESFLTFHGPSLARATSLRLYRVIDQQLFGPRTTYVAEREAVDDGQSIVYTHYNFEGGVPTPSGEGGVFNKATVTYSGASEGPDTRNGRSEHYFYTGGDAPYAPGESNAPQYPAITLGVPYYSRTLRNNNGALEEDSSEKRTWRVQELTLVRNEKAYFPVVTALETVQDGMRQAVSLAYEPNGKGLPARVSSSRKDVTGREETRSTRYLYAWSYYPELERQNNITAALGSVVTEGTLTVAASGSQWTQVRPAAAPTPGAWRGLGYPVWASNATYHSLDHTVSELPAAGTPPEAHWRRSEQVTARTPEGWARETADVEGNVLSTVFDSARHNAIATIAGASVAGNQAGYLGFGPTESRAGWAITRDSEPAGRFHTGPGCIAGGSASVTPQQFAPRPGIAYQVGAWILCEQGPGALIGFGPNQRAIPPAPGWRWVEHTVAAPARNEPPTVKCNGLIDCFYFGPVDAKLAVTVRDPVFGLPITRIDGHGTVSRRLYDERQNLVAEIGPGERLLALHFHRPVSNLAKALRGEGGPTEAWPDTTLTITAQDGGRYVAAEPAPLKDKDRILLFQATSFAGRAVGVGPTGYAVRFRYSPAPRQCLNVSFGSALIEISQESIRLLDPKGNGGFTGATGSDEFLILSIGPRLMVFVGLQLLLSQDVQSPGNGCLSARPGSDPVRVREVYEAYSPILSLGYTDGLGRPIQAVGQHPNGSPLIAAQTVYDGWGQAAVTTQPIPVEWTARYQPGLVATYDWDSGRLTGAVSRYYDRIFTDPAVKEDAEYACTRVVRESSPLARVVETTRPGKRFAPRSLKNVRIDYTRSADARWVFDRVGIPRTEDYRTETRYLPAGPAGVSAQVEVFDRFGSLIARATGAGTEKSISTYRSERTADGYLYQYTYPPNRYRTGPPGYPETLTFLNFLGQVITYRDADTGADLRLYDLAGRLRCFLTQASISGTPPRFYYRCYDLAGRPVEAGYSERRWEDAPMQAAINTDRTWPSREATSTWTTRWFYDTDVSSPAGAAVSNANGRLREVQERSADGQIATERYLYDPRGRVMQVEQRVSAFDNQPRVTRYEYDALGRASGVHYPGAGSRTVWSLPNPAGLMCRLGEEAQQDRFASYEYNLDGTVASEMLNNRRIRGQFRYDQYANLVDIEYTGANGDRFLQETLEYGQGSAGAGLNSITFAPSRATPRGHRYRFEYNYLNRLVKATTEAGPGLEKVPLWELTAPNGEPLQIDPNGNLPARKEGAAPYTPVYQQQSNRLDTFTDLGQPTQPLTHDRSGRLTSFGPHRAIQYGGNRSVPDSVETYGGTLQLRYDAAGKRVLKQWQSQKKLYTHGLAAQPLLECTAAPAEETQYIYSGTSLVVYVRSGRTFFVIPDHLGSTRLIVDSDGNHQAHFNYLPFGGLQKDNSSAGKESPISYLSTGHELDFELNC
ncbi:MAG: hypothetical protein K0Q72_2917, partial [Armatimonadetes bacterium]|nr:hypothetical protein [Armatimonadota bacterium]